MSNPKIALASEPATRSAALTRLHRSQRRDAAATQLSAPLQAMPANTPDLFSWIDLLAESIRVRTSAIGAAVALTVGEQWRCCGSAGTAPPKGIVVSAESTLVGECVRTGQVVGSVDAASDGIAAGSVLLAPIHQDGAVIGVLGLFWCEPLAISDANIAIARAGTGMIAASLGTTRRPANHSPECVAISAERAVGQVNVPDAAANKNEGALESQQSGISTPLGIVKKLYGLPCAKCGSYYFSDEASCPICSA